MNQQLKNKKLIKDKIRKMKKLILMIKQQGDKIRLQELMPAVLDILEQPITESILIMSAIIDHHIDISKHINREEIKDESARKHN